MPVPARWSPLQSRAPSARRSRGRRPRVARPGTACRASGSCPSRCSRGAPRRPSDSGSSARPRLSRPARSRPALVPECSPTPGGRHQGAPQWLAGPDVSRCPARRARARRSGGPATPRRRGCRRAGTCPGPATTTGGTDSAASAVDVSGRRLATRRSVMNGVNGAIQPRSSTSSVSCNVPSALGSPLQNRRRDLRTYQLDRSSTNCAMSWPARWVSKVSIATVTSW